MANADGSSLIAADFAPGTSEKFIKAGTFLGFMGDYSGDPNSPTGIHLHFSIDKDDGSGHFTNELQISNTLDPSPYFGLPLNATTNPTLPILCPAENSTPNS
jgi:murein DD-endopeptidase MepM/ murein hydrolase activator NlpD